jgi:hypothetical protein
MIEKRSGEAGQNLQRELSRGLFSWGDLVMVHYYRCFRSRSGTHLDGSAMECNAMGDSWCFPFYTVGAGLCFMAALHWGCMPCYFRATPVTDGKGMGSGAIMRGKTSNNGAHRGRRGLGIEAESFWLRVDTVLSLRFMGVPCLIGDMFIS